MILNTPGHWWERDEGGHCRRAGRCTMKLPLTTQSSIGVENTAPYCSSHHLDSLQRNPLWLYDCVFRASPPSSPTPCIPCLRHGDIPSGCILSPPILFVSHLSILGSFIALLILRWLSGSAHFFPALNSLLATVHFHLPDSLPASNTTAGPPMLFPKMLLQVVLIPQMTPMFLVPSYKPFSLHLLALSHCSLPLDYWAILNPPVLELLNLFFQLSQVLCL